MMPPPVRTPPGAVLPLGVPQPAVVGLALLLLLAACTPRTTYTRIDQYNTGTMGVPVGVGIADPPSNFGEIRATVDYVGSPAMPVPAAESVAAGGVYARHQLEGRLTYGISDHWTIYARVGHGFTSSLQATRDDIGMDQLPQLRNYQIGVGARFIGQSDGIVRPMAGLEWGHDFMANRYDTTVRRSDEPLGPPAGPISLADEDRQWTGVHGLASAHLRLTGGALIAVHERIWVGLGMSLETFSQVDAYSGKTYEGTYWGGWGNREGRLRRWDARTVRPALVPEAGVSFDLDAVLLQAGVAAPIAAAATGVPIRPIWRLGMTYRLRRQAPETARRPGAAPYSTRPGRAAVWEDRYRAPSYQTAPHPYGDQGVPTGYPGADPYPSQGVP